MPVAGPLNEFGPPSLIQTSLQIQVRRSPEFSLDPVEIE
jgi:hypothetical protein